MFDAITVFEQQLAQYTGSRYAVMTDCCTHAIELCLRYQKPSHCAFTAFTYLSIPMTMHKLGIEYRLIPEVWTGEYQFHGTTIWDSARRLEAGMYRPGMMQCVSFGFNKPLPVGRGGAILLDNEDDYHALSCMRYDGRDLSVSPWQHQSVFRVGYHYRPTIEEAQSAQAALEQLKLNPVVPQHHQYPDCRNITIL
jgi:dTDP-4-amino-4,6-dideoxygalactose transaminase